MRIWHEDLIPYLCRQHLLACWREGLGCYSILIDNKRGYRHHPAVKEFENHEDLLYQRLKLIRTEMLKRGYHPQELPPTPTALPINTSPYRPWQTLEEQIAVLEKKDCPCYLNISLAKL